MIPILGLVSGQVDVSPETVLISGKITFHIPLHNQHSTTIINMKHKSRTFSAKGVKIYINNQIKSKVQIFCRVLPRLKQRHAFPFNHSLRDLPFLPLILEAFLHKQILHVHSTYMHIRTCYMYTVYSTAVLKTKNGQEETPLYYKSLPFQIYRWNGGKRRCIYSQTNVRFHFCFSGPLFLTYLVSSALSLLLSLAKF